MSPNRDRANSEFKFQNDARLVCMNMNIRNMTLVKPVLINISSLLEIGLLSSARIIATLRSWRPVHPLAIFRSQPEFTSPSPSKSVIFTHKCFAELIEFAFAKRSRDATVAWPGCKFLNISQCRIELFWKTTSKSKGVYPTQYIRRRRI